MTFLCRICRYLHDEDGLCWHDRCQGCDGEFTMGPSTSPLCGVCAQADGEEGR